MHWAWRNAKVTFDKVPKSKSTSFVDGISKPEYHGIKPLLLTAWAYTEQLMQEGTIKKSEEKCVPEFENYKVMLKEWTSQELHHDSWKQTLERYLSSAHISSLKFGHFLQNLTSRHQENVAKIIRGHFDLSLRNGFSNLHLGHRAVSTWKWNHESVREYYHLWSHAFDILIDIVHCSRLPKREASEPDYGTDILFNEVFEAHQPGYTLLLRWIQDSTRSSDIIPL
jgi:hypothetical protein